MQPANCPRCNMLLAPGAQVCPNCHLNLMQFTFQQQGPPSMEGSLESPKETAYRKLLMIIAIVMMGDFLVLHKIPQYTYEWFGGDLYSITRYLSWLTTLAWAGLPLVIALLLPKSNAQRVVLIVFASIYALWKISSFFYSEFFIGSWGRDPFLYQQF